MSLRRFSSLPLTSASVAGFTFKIHHLGFPFQPSLNLSADFLLFWDGGNERHTKWNERHKCSAEISKTALKFFAIRPIQGRHKRKPPCKHINSDSPAFQAVSAVKPACGNSRPPHMAAYHMRRLAFVYPLSQQRHTSRQFVYFLFRTADGNPIIIQFRFWNVLHLFNKLIIGLAPLCKV